MPASTPSVLSLLAAGLYLAITSAALFAAYTARSRKQVDWHSHGWALVSVLFLVLAAMRWFAAEDVLRAELRAFLYAEGAYDTRRALQGPLIAALIGGAVLFGTLWFGNLFRKARGRRDVAVVGAMGCVAGMIVLVALRLVSLHSLDQLLYGALKINWLADIGLSGLTLFCALAYVRVVRGGGRVRRS